MPKSSQILTEQELREQQLNQRDNESATTNTNNNVMNLDTWIEFDTACQQAITLLDQLEQQQHNDGDSIISSSTTERKEEQLVQAVESIRTLVHNRNIEKKQTASSMSNNTNIEAKQIYMELVTDAFADELDAIRQQQEELRMKSMNSLNINNERDMEILVDTLERGLEVWTKQEQSLLIKTNSNSNSDTVRSKHETA